MTRIPQRLFCHLDFKNALYGMNIDLPHLDSVLTKHICNGKYFNNFCKCKTG